jgi:hypothetical protein
MWHVWETGELHAILVGRPDRSKHLEGLGIDRSIILKEIFKKGNGTTKTGLIWFRIGTRGGHL